MPMSLLPEDHLIATRATLIHRLKDWQDQSGWQDFFDTYSRLIFTLAVKSGLTAEEARDIVQETTLAVAKQMPTFQYDPSIGSFKSWLLTMTRWRILDHIRKKNQTPQAFYEEAPEGETQALDKIADPASLNLNGLWETEWADNLLTVAVAKVKRQVAPEKFQIFDFYVNKGWSPEDVASCFDIETSQVYLIKHRIAEMIKAEVERLDKASE